MFRDKSEQKKTADKLEKWLAKDLGGFRVPGSGSIVSFKGDVQTDNYLIDSKHTLNSAIKVVNADFSKIYREAREADKEAGHIILTFYKEFQHFAVVPKRDFSEPSLELEVLINKTTLLSSTSIKGIKRKLLKEQNNKLFSILFRFQIMKLGTPREWLLLDWDIYKKYFFEAHDG